MLPDPGEGGTFRVVAEVDGGLLVEVEGGGRFVWRWLVEDPAASGPGGPSAGRGVSRTLPSWLQRGQRASPVGAGRGANSSGRESAQPGAAPREEAVGSQAVPAAARRPTPNPSLQATLEAGASRGAAGSGRGPGLPGDAQRAGGARSQDADGTPPHGTAAASRLEVPDQGVLPAQAGGLDAQNSSVDADGSAVQADAADGWECFIDPATNQSWWWHEATGQCSWEPPERRPEH